jgi:hypothetical protein
MKRIIAAAVLAALLIAGYATGDVPQTISYQGVLKDDTGVIVPDGDYDFTFAIYNVASGGTGLWTEYQTKHVTAGILNAVLGDVTPIALRFDEPYWLGVTIGAGDELLPRTPLTGSPYALNARAVIGTHNVFPDSGAVGIGTTSPGEALHVVSPDIHVMEAEGTAAGAWALLDINAAGLGSNPGIEYLKQGALKAVTFVGSGDDLIFRVGANDAFRIESGTGNCGVGLLDPLERLDVSGALRLGMTDSTNAGTIRWTGTDFEGYDGGSWLSLTTGGSGSLPTGSLGQTIRHNGSGWVASSLLYNNGDRIGIGTTIPTAELEVVGDNMTNHFKLTAATGAGPALYLNAVNKDWTIYGSNPGSSAGDRKLVFRDFSAAADRMVIDENGHVGIGEISPEATLHLEGGNWNLDQEGGDFKIGDDTYQLRFGIMTGTVWAGNAGIRVNGGKEILTLNCGDEQTLMLTPGGKVYIGYPDIIGSAFGLYPHGAWGRSDSLGGVLGISHHSSGFASGYMHSVHEDFSVEMRLARGLNELEQPMWGFEYNGSYAGSAEPHLYITGSSRAALFKMNEYDDGSVQLPVGAISAQEILDEPGAASITEGSLHTDLDGTVQTLISRTVTVPAGGYVLVMATAQPLILHTQGTASDADFGVSNTAGSLPANQDVNLELSSAIPSGQYCFPVTVHGLFEVASSGVYTFHLVAQEHSGFFEVYDIQFTELFIPTAYGTVAATMGAAIADDRSPARAPLTTADLAVERNESEAFNRERIERELARMRDQIRALEQAVSRDSYVRAEKAE